MRRPQTFTLKSACLLLSAMLAFSVSVFAAQPPEKRVNINSASVEDLQTLPGIGQKLAARIVEHRQKHGPFKRPQDVIVVRGMSAKRFRQIAHLILADPITTEAAKKP